ncbi:FAD-binding oxidoreductase [Candidatus Kaiserbacteria bacterium]|nr:FAD-binding oxidoreductase [Candidatus Kaiserbacteria bacterium]
MHNPRKEVYWYTKKPLSKTRPLAEHLSADAVVIGGGMAGLAVAERLANAGKKVIVLEREFCGAGASGRSSGFITQDSELELIDLIENLGKERAKRLWEFVGNSMEIMRSNIKTHSIECDYQEQDYIFIANDRRGFRKVLREHNGREILGYESYLYDAKTVRGVLGSHDYKGAIRYPGTFAINSYLYAQAMRDVLMKMGVRIFEGTDVSSIDARGVATADGRRRVNAEYIIVCVDKFLPRLKCFKKDVYHVETYLTLSKPLHEKDIARLFPSGHLMVTDSDMIYQYYRITGEGRLLLGGGNYLTTYAYGASKKPEQIIPKLARYMKKKFPDVSVEFEYVWPGLLGVSKDLVPLAGRDRSMPNVYYIAGASGLAWASGLGNYLGEQILNGRDDYDDLFSPYRTFPFDPIMRVLQHLITTPMAFGLSHAFVKYLR